MQAFATELVSIITNGFSNFLGGLGAPMVGFFTDVFVVDPTGTPTPSVLAYVALTFAGIGITYKFIPMLLRLLKVRR